MSTVAIARSSRFCFDELFHGIRHKADRAGYKLAQRVLTGDYAWLESGTLHKE